MNNILKEKENIYNILQTFICEKDCFLYFNKKNDYLFVSNIIRFIDRIDNLQNYLDKLGIKTFLNNNLLYINPNYDFIINHETNIDFEIDLNSKLQHIYRIIKSSNLSTFLDTKTINNIIKMKYIDENKYYNEVLNYLALQKRQKKTISLYALNIIKIVCTKEKVQVK